MRDFLILITLDGKIIKLLKQCTTILKFKCTVLIFGMHFLTHAQKVITFGIDDRYKIGSDAFEYLEDSSGTFTIQDIVSVPGITTLFTSQPPDESSAMQSYFWMRFSVVNPNILPLVLDTHLPLQTAVMFYPRADGIFYSDTSGLHVRGDSPRISYTNETFFIPFSTTPVTYYLRFKRLAPGTPYFGFKPIEYYSNRTHFITLISGIVLGIMLLIVGFAFIMFIRMRAEYYFFLGLFVISFSFFELKIQGFLNYYLWIVNPDWNQYLMFYNIPYSLSTIFLLLYINSGLRLNRFMPWLYWLNLALIGVKLFFIAAGNLQYPYLRHAFFDTWFMTPSIIGGGVLAFKRGNEAAFFLVSIASIYLGMLLKSVPPQWLRLSGDNIEIIYASFAILGII